MRLQAVEQVRHAGQDESQLRVGYFLNLVSCVLLVAKTLFFEAFCQQSRQTDPNQTVGDHVFHHEYGSRLFFQSMCSQAALLECRALEGCRVCRQFLQQQLQGTLLLDLPSDRFERSPHKVVVEQSLQEVNAGHMGAHFHDLQM